MSKEKTITRFPPSPTGFFHIGSARTALFNYLFAQNRDGEMIFRFEDTDKERNKEEYEQDILEGLKWLGIGYGNKKPFKQSEREEIYEKYLQKLLDEDKAYLSKEEEGDRDEVIRFRNPGGEVGFEDKIRGKVSFDISELGDFVIAKSINEPLYHLAVVVDDYEMGITDVIRGEDHISNTPRQILIMEALGFKRPNYAHIPLILAPDKTKLSKRHGAISVNEYREMGYKPEALVNYLALLGWNPGDEREIFGMEDLIKEFSLERVHKSGAVFDIEKLKWINKQYITSEDIKQGLKKNTKIPEENLEKVTSIVKERISVLEEISEMEKAGELSYFEKEPNYQKKLLYWKGESDDNLYLRHLEEVKKMIEKLPEDSGTEDIKNAIWDYASQEGRGEVLWPLRVALSGKEKSPDPFELIYALGLKESTKRIENAISILNE